MAGGHGPIAKPMADVSRRALGLPPNLFGTLANRLAGVAHCPAEVPHRCAHPFFGARHTSSGSTA